MVKIIKQVLRRLLDIRPIRKRQILKGKNTKLPSGLIGLIHSWENPKDELTIRSSFNRELYYKYLKAVQNETTN